MSKTYRLQLSVSPVTCREADYTLGAIQRAWCTPSWANKQSLGHEILLLAVGHEAEIKLGESADWFVERIAAAIWQETGRFVRIAIDIAADEAADGQLIILDEAAYWRIMQSFRLSSPRFHS